MADRRPLTGAVGPQLGVCRQDRHVGHNADAIDTGTRGIGVNTTIGARKLQHEPTLEEVVRDTLRPMLKPWLDENLPSLVERMVEAEIERVARRR